MKASDSSLKYNPFGDLKNRFQIRPLPKLRSPAKTLSHTEPAALPEIEENIFQEAMQDVQPILDDKYARENGAAKTPVADKKVSETEDMVHLENLLKYGEGFVISATPEYMEGTGYDIHPEFARRLHQGDFSIQAHIDLHGLGIHEAQEKFEQFLKGAVTSGKRAVLIIHGRGLSSPGEPVLKNKVREWITHGHWRKWVIAYASAQNYDGGAGATYILLRHRPLSKRSKKQQSKK